jgi:hypothetical protein
MRNSTSSHLYNQNTFYKAFLYDLELTHSLSVIESPFNTKKRINILFPTLFKLKLKRVRIVIYIKPFIQYKLLYRNHAMSKVVQRNALALMILLTNGHYRKLAIINDCILWAGRLNILSFNIMSYHLYNVGQQ